MNYYFSIVIIKHYSNDYIFLYKKKFSENS